MVFSPGSGRIGTIRSPENCANPFFEGPKRNRLFMTAGPSLYAIYAGVPGAPIA